MGILDIGYGAIIGLSLGLTGAGGSIITIPILIYLLNMNAHVATGTSLVIVGVGALAGAIQYAFGK
ncbi:TSUP family transporter, partial [Athalassotoga sp.]|uniref:TSUP family transporter n=1 Tax=Athalassotoga sp. TaxID=2022597 RepID=UPI003D002278